MSETFVYCALVVAPHKYILLYRRQIRRWHFSKPNAFFETPIVALPRVRSSRETSYVRRRVAKRPFGARNQQGPVGPNPSIGTRSGTGELNPLQSRMHYFRDALP